ncbi:MAG: MgtC/SapB family protein [Burkholderiales bacterium]
MLALPENLLLGFLVALGSGLLIGVERERRKGAGPDRALAGVRTFTLAALAGAIAQALEQPLLVAAGAVMILALSAIAYLRSRESDPGVTTELAFFVTYLLGVVAIPQPGVAAAGAVVVAGLLAARSRLHRFSTQVLTEREMRDALLFAGAVLIMLPLTPDEAIAWLGGTNPHVVWTYAVVIMAMQGAGYIAQRWLGTQRGMALSGLASGFVSSTATIIALGARVRKEPALLEASVAGSLFATMATFILFAVITASIHAPALAVLAAPLAAGLVATVLCAAWFYRSSAGAKPPENRPGRAFNLWHASGFAVGVAALSTAVGLANQFAGNAAAQVGAAVAGILDAHSAGASLLALAADGRLPADVLAFSCLLAISTNAVSKTVGAFATGGVRFGWRVAVGLAAGIAAAWAVELLLQ